MKIFSIHLKLKYEFSNHRIEQSFGWTIYFVLYHHSSVSLWETTASNYMVQMSFQYTHLDTFINSCHVCPYWQNIWVLTINFESIYMVVWRFPSRYNFQFWVKVNTHTNFLFGVNETRINTFECSRTFKSLYIHTFIIITINHHNFFARFAVTKDLTGGNNLQFNILSIE